MLTHKQFELDFEKAMRPAMERIGGGTPHPLQSGSRERLFELQALGDFIMKETSSGEFRTIELKVERRFTGNFFIEEWSNRSTRRDGWFHTLKADWLLYGFVEPNRVWYGIPWKKFRAWLCEVGGNPPQQRWDGYTLRLQRQTEQFNDTWGRLVPIADIRKSGLIQFEENW